MAALNSLLGYGSQPGPSRCGVHVAIRAEVVGVLVFFKPRDPDAIVNDEAALRKLLKGRSVYDVSRSCRSVKPYETGPAALPTDSENCPNLADALPAVDRLYLEGNHERMRNCGQQLDAPIVKPYFNEVLRRHRRTYVKCARQLLQLGLVCITRGCKSEVDCFSFQAKLFIAADH